jgi:hypothetical protein
MEEREGEWPSVLPPTVDGRVRAYSPTLARLDVVEVSLVARPQTSEPLERHPTHGEAVAWITDDPTRAACPVEVPENGLRHGALLPLSTVEYARI